MIRPATPADAEALAALAALTPGAPVWTPASFRSMLTTAAATHALWVLHPADALLGFVALSLHPPQAELESIVVHPAHQGRGYGRALLTTALQHAQSRGAQQVYLEVRSSSPAQSLYRRLGFIPTGLRPRYYTHPVEDAVLMQWTTAAQPPSPDSLSGRITTDYGS